MWYFNDQDNILFDDYDIIKILFTYEYNCGILTIKILFHISIKILFHISIKILFHISIKILFHISIKILFT